MAAIQLFLTLFLAFTVVALSAALRVEARRYGVNVSVLCPGVIRTPILGGGRFGNLKEGLDPASLAAHFERRLPMNPDVLARRVLRAVERDRAIIIEPKAARILWYLHRLCPRLAAKLPVGIPLPVRGHAADQPGE